jgi:hypothetical protein
MVQEKNKEKMEDLANIEFCIESDSVLGGFYFNNKVEKFCLENHINFKKFKIFISTLLICSTLSFSSAQGKTIEHQQSISIVQNLQKNSEKKSKIFSPGKKVLKKKVNEIENFDPFNDEIKQEIRNCQKFIGDLEKFNETKSLNQKNYPLKIANNEILIKANPIVLANNSPTLSNEKFSKEEKTIYTKKFIATINFIRKHKMIIISFLVGSILLVIYFFLKAAKVSLLPNTLNKLKKVFDLKPGNTITIIENLNSRTQLVENSSTEVAEKVVEEISSLEINNNSTLEIFEEENLIFPETNEISLNKEDLRTCINYGQILKAEEVLFNEDKSKLDRVKEYFLEHGEEISSTDEEWMSIAKGIKLEMDRLLQDRIKWEKDLEIYLETCQ